jgi:hypothetical protein
LSIAVGFAESW